MAAESRGQLSDAGLVGEVIGGDYLVEHRVESGGMAWVYRATHQRLGGEVAIKVLFSHMADNPDVRKRFLREAQSQYTLNHPNIARVLDFVEEQGLVGFVLEWCDGGELTDWLADSQSGRSLGQVATLFIQLLDAMQYAHEEGIIHRDLKPQNILFQRRGTELVPKVTDFGIAKYAQLSGETKPGVMVGTLQYMSPEQVRGEKALDARSDIYSLGVILYQMLAGHLPFAGESMSLIMQVLEKEPPRLSAEAVPLPLRQVVMKCLEKDPAHRFSSCAEVRVAIEDVLQATPTVLSVGSDLAGDTRESAVPVPSSFGVTTEESEALAPTDDLAQYMTMDAEDDFKPFPVDVMQQLEESVGVVQPPPEEESFPATMDSVARRVPVMLTEEGVVRAPSPSRPYVPKPRSRGMRKVMLALLLLLLGGGLGAFVVYQERMHFGWWDKNKPWGRVVGLDGGVSPPQQHVSIRPMPRVVPDMRSVRPQPRRVLRTPLARCEKGDKRACFVWGMKQLRGSMDKVTQRKVVIVLMRACRARHTKSCLLLGMALHQGKSLARDDLKARLVWKEACQRGMMKGCVSLGHLLRQGFGGPPEPSKARGLYQRACRGGLRIGCKALKTYFSPSVRVFE